MAFIAVLLLFISTQSLDAQKKLLGGDISYQHLDSNKYKFRLNLYRPCQDSALPNTVNAFALSNALNKYDSLIFSRDSIKENNNICRSGTSPCLPQNTAATAVGMEIHYYSCTINFNDSLYKDWLDSGACKIYINYTRFSQTYGYDDIGDSFLKLFTYINFCNLRKCKDTTNQGIVYNPPPNSYLNCNTPFRYNMGGTTLDNDSLMHFTSCYKPIFSRRNCSTNGYFNYLTTYCPFGFPNPCAAIPDASPPIGMFFDTFNADLIFMPTNCSEVGQFYNFSEEWRKDTSGIKQLIGLTSRFIIFIVDSFGTNNPPEILPKYNYSVCEGEELCFDIRTKDVATKLPPPASQPAPDTTYLSWSNNIANATLTYKDSTAREKTGRFCWTPPIGTARTLAYQFTVTVSDSACPRAEKSSRNFDIIVNPKAWPKSNIQLSNCGKAVFSGNDSIAAIFFSEWEIYNPKDSLIYKGKKHKDSVIIIREGGNYTFKYTSTNLQGCSKTKTDTIFIPPYLNAVMLSDTSGCLNDTIKLFSQPINAIGKIKYTWKDENTGKVIDSLSFLNLRLKYINTISLQMQDSLGCSVSDTFSVKINQPYGPEIGADLRICASDSIQLSVKNPGVKIKYLWSTGDTTTKTKYLNRNNTYTLNTTDSNGCHGTDSLALNVNQPVVALPGNDATVCYNTRYTLQARDSSYPNVSQTWYWYDLDNNILIAAQKSFSILLTSNKKYRLLTNQIEGKLLCRDDDTIALTVQYPDTLSLQNSVSFCFSDSFVDLDKASKSSVLGSKWSLIGFNSNSPSSPSFNAAEKLIIDSAILYPFNSPGQYQLLATNTRSGCVAKDSFMVIVNPAPNLVLQELDTLCFGEALKLKAITTVDSWYGTGVIRDSFFTQNATALNNSQIYYGPHKIYATYTDPNTHCTSFDSIDVVIKSQPLLSIINPNPSSICAGEQINLKLSNTRNDGQFIWKTFGDGSFSNNLDTVTTYTPSINEINQGSTSIFVTTQSTSYNCPIDSLKLDIVIHPLPIINIEVDKMQGCQPLITSAKIKGNIDSFRYQWTSSEETSNSQKPTFTFNKLGYGLINLVLEDKRTACKNSATLDSIIVHELPKASFKILPDPTVSDHNLVFNFISTATIGKGNISNYLWGFEDGSTDTGLAVKHSYANKVGQYWVKHSVISNEGCRADTSLTHPISIVETFYAPNAFSPNNDGPWQNNKYTVNAIGFKEFSINIYNRWGELIYQSKDAINHGWDGNYLGKPCPSGSYFCIINTTTQNNLFVGRKINILLIR